MKYAGIPMGMWTLFHHSFTQQLTLKFGLTQQQAKAVETLAKPKYQEIIAKLPEFEKADHFKMNIVNTAMLAAYILNMPKRPEVEPLTAYYTDAMMIPLVKCVISTTTWPTPMAAPILCGSTPSLPAGRTATAATVKNKSTNSNQLNTQKAAHPCRNCSALGVLFWFMGLESGHR